VALERQSIEKKDFPIGRRGYDPDAVDQHLAALADEVEELKRSSRRRSETLATAASEQVRAIVEAAESSAAEIERRAEEDAREIRGEASAEAAATREQASAQAREYVSRVSESTAVMMQRLEAMESELGALIEALRTGGNRLSADLQLLEGSMGEVREAVAPRPRFEPEPSDTTAAAVSSPASVGGRPSAEVEEQPSAVARDRSPEAGYEEPDDEPGEAGDEDEIEGARLIALNMALNGSSRDETDRYLAENFHLSDRERLLDEVFASVEG
jgi:DivIVA domain-containing protein